MRELRGQKEEEWEEMKHKGVDHMWGLVVHYDLCCFP
jgi:hypothetical protein